jgi:hypothetical protein
LPSSSAAARRNVDVAHEIALWQQKLLDKEKENEKQKGEARSLPCYWLPFLSCCYCSDGADAEFCCSVTEPSCAVRHAPD